MPRKVDLEVRRRQAEKWNKKHAVGTEVHVTLDERNEYGHPKEVAAKTTSAAWVLDDGTLVVKTDATGDAGYLLKRGEVRPLCRVSFGRGRLQLITQSEASALISALAGK